MHYLTKFQVWTLLSGNNDRRRSAGDPVCRPYWGWWELGNTPLGITEMRTTRWGPYASTLLGMMEPGSPLLESKKHSFPPMYYLTKSRVGILLLSGECEIFCWMNTSAGKEPLLLED